jgi:hypothetical protein
VSELTHALQTCTWHSSHWRRQVGNVIAHCTVCNSFELAVKTYQKQRCACVACTPLRQKPLEPGAFIRKRGCSCGEAELCLWLKALCPLLLLLLLVLLLRAGLSRLLGDVPVPELLRNKQLTSVNMWFSSRYRHVVRLPAVHSAMHSPAAQLPTFWLQ